LDSNGDGIMDDGEQGMDGITVTLELNGEEAETTTTAEGGWYAFASLPASGATFQIHVTIPSGYEATIEDAVGPGIDSNIDAEGDSDAIPGTESAECNAGLVVARKQNLTDTLRWNPQAGSTLASVVTNWWDVTQKFQLTLDDPGPGEETPIEFNPVPGDGTPGSNNPIDWDESFTVASISLIQYGGQQTVRGKVESLGAGGTALSMTGDTLDLNLINPNSTFQVDNNATITNFVFTGPHNADNDFESFIINGGTTTISEKNYVQNLGVDLDIMADATLVDRNQSAITLTADSVKINIFGEMDTYTGRGNQNTMIGGGAAFSDDFISVNGGTLVYYGMANTQDTITVPIEVYNGGTLKLTVAPGSFAGKLVVQGGVPNTNNNSVDLYGPKSKVTLDHFDTLQAEKGYYQSSGTLETLDFSGGTLQPSTGPGAGIATIAGGSVVINEGSGYGQLQVTGATLNFNGALDVAIDATNQNNKGLLEAPFGTINLQAKSTLTVYVNNGQPAAGLQWFVINAANPINPGNFIMPMDIIPGYNLSDGVNPNNNKQYTVSS
jgi:hypothetical protein